MDIKQLADEKILILDGAMGTMIQRHNLTEDDFRRGMENASASRLAGCNDLLCLTRPDVISAIHREYVDAGCDIISTNSFNANAVSMAEYGLESYVADICRAAARLAREAADGAERRKVWVAGSMGPSNVALSLPEVAGERGVDFDVMRRAYREQALALAEGGVDLLLLETMFDTLNAKAAIAGVEDAFDSLGRRLPLIISMTLTQQGRTLSGQTPEAFIAAVAHAGPLAIGLNCGFGADGMEPWLRRIQQVGCMVSLHPNAGLPDEMGDYTETPEMMAAVMRRFMEQGLVNIAGGCCGTTPAHIRAIAAAAAGLAPRRHQSPDSRIMTLAGTETLTVAEGDFLKVGERCNVAGSRKFLRLINEGATAEAIGIAAAQLDKGARVLDVNLDDGMLDAPVEMERFVIMLGQDGSTAPAPLMVDSSDMEVIRRALHHIQGRPIVNSISLKEGEEKFLSHAREIRRLGAAVVVMAFDEQGQATDFDRRVAICSRAYRLLTEKAGFHGEDIVFDPNVLTIATGMKEHDRYALDFLEAVEWIKKNLPGAKVSGGVSNLSFAFRGNNKLREAMHTVFLHHAISRGMDMAIVNPASSVDASTVEPTLREAIEDTIFMRRPDATDRLLDIAAEMKREADELKSRKAAANNQSPAPAAPTADTRSLGYLIEKGLTDGIEELLDKALEEEGSAMAVVSRRLMEAMKKVGDEFGAGRMFLPQVVRAASVMKRAIDILTPRIEAEASADNSGASDHGKFVIATVKGDVHDIGKNIVGVILKCGGFDVIDLGVMVDGERIVETLKSTDAKFLGLSGLITPSLAEMGKVVTMLQNEEMTDVTVCVGGATTSDLHTAVRLAPLFDGLVVHTRDAAQLPVIASRLADPDSYEEAAAEIDAVQRRLSEDYSLKMKNRASASSTADSQPDDKSGASQAVKAPLADGLVDMTFSPESLTSLINWRAFLHTWSLPPQIADKALRHAQGEATTRPAHAGGCSCCPHPEHVADQDDNTDDHALDEATRLIADALDMIDRLTEAGCRLWARAIVADAHREADDIRLADDEGIEVRIPTLRDAGATGLAMADFVAESDDHVGVFVVTAREILTDGRHFAPDSYREMLLQSVADRLVEAATEEMHSHVHQSQWNLQSPRGIRPAIGYPSLPDQTLVFELDKILHYSEFGIELTENGALSPSATTTGLILASPGARYFEIGELSDEAIADYARRRGMTIQRIRDILRR